MYSTPEQLIAANKAFVDAMLLLTKTALASAERIAALNLNAAHSIVEESVAHAIALSEAKDLQGFMALQATQAKPIVEQVISYNRSLYEISGQTKEEVAKLLDRQFAEFQHQVSSLMESAARNAPPGSEVAFAAVKSALEAASSALDNMKKLVKQADDLAETNIARASSATVDAVDSVRRR